MSAPSISIGGFSVLTQPAHPGLVWLGIYDEGQWLTIEQASALVAALQACIEEWERRQGGAQ